MRALVRRARVMPRLPGLADHLVGLEGRRRDSEAERLAVLRLTISSSVVGCCHGQVGGLAPLKILSIYLAKRRNLSASFPR